MPRKRILLAVALISAVTIPPLAGFVFLFSPRDLFTSTPFDAVGWQAGGGMKDEIRLGMADDLLAKNTLIGKSRPEVTDLLGEPPPTPYLRGWDLVYWLGPERGFMSIDSEWLVVRFGNDGRVTENRIVRD